MRRYIVLVIIGLFLFAANVKAWECEYGSVNAWVKLNGDTQWREAMVDGVSLKVHEPFKVKVQITTKTECNNVDIKLYDPGVTKVFEVVEGPSKNGEHILKYDVPANWTKTYEWTVRPTGKWTEGWAPLNIWITFSKGLYKDKIIDKTIIHAYISPKEWKGGNEGGGNTNEESNSNHHTPGFEAIILIFAIALYIWRKR